MIIDEIPTWCWGMAYMSLIPGFALVYAFFMGGDFFHSTVQYEPALDEEAKSVIGNLQQDIRDNFRQGYGGETARVGNLSVAASDIAVTSLRPAREEMAFEVVFEFHAEEAGVSRGKLGFEAAYRIGRGEELINVTQQVYYKLLTFSPEQVLVPGVGQISYQAIFPLTGGFLVPVLPLSRETTSNLDGFWEASQGHPHRVSGQFLRMIYLSAVTVTTIGYGDIVPLTGNARAAVTVEAVLGIVLIGLFLNSLF